MNSLQITQTSKLALRVVLVVQFIITVGLLSAVVFLGTRDGYNSCDSSCEVHDTAEGNTTEGPEAPALPQTDVEKMKIQDEMMRSVLRCEPMLVGVPIREELNSVDSLRDENLVTTRVPTQRCPPFGLCYGANGCRPKNYNYKEVYIRYVSENGTVYAEKKTVRNDLECSCM